ncbi:hypothetical protein [Myxococcus sp. AS-1-15]|uniref:LexA family protein n=1 Tax=Myxococcus sp. AS-1-15 TaxID=2874600 RepID=UPI001CBEDAD7|nr:hypothetical protein [Myxococcus sp. AS-1-15]MBZ4400391.1 hypothetical protein [Myxococcus sp. AS-1-15]
MSRHCSNPRPPIHRPKAEHGPTSDEPVTARQLEVLVTIATHTAETGRPPSYRELADALDIRSTNGVQDHVKALRKKRCLTPGDGGPVTARGLVLTESGKELVAQGQSAVATKELKKGVSHG